MTNAIKYAFAEAQPGQVHVDLDREQERLVLTVRDNGCGYSPSAESGLGTRLVTTLQRSLADQPVGTRAEAGAARSPLFFQRRGWGIEHMRGLGIVADPPSVLALGCTFVPSVERSRLKLSRSRSPVEAAANSRANITDMGTSIPSSAAAVIAA